MKKEFTYEPGVIRAFRLFAGVRLAMTLFSALAYLLVSAFREFNFDSSIVLEVGDAALLFIYLSLPWLLKWLKGWYLPIGIVLSSLGPILELQIGLVQNNLVTSEFAIQVSAWQTIPVLFIPLFIMAWQYRFRWVVLFSLLTALADLTSLIFYPVALPAAWVGRTLVGPVFARTGTFLFIGYMINQLVNAQRKQREELAQANAGLAHYAVTLEQLATSRERNRVARELHDILAHTLSGMAIELEAVKKLWHIDPDKASTMLNHSIGSVHEGLTESRRALQALRATPLDDLGLVFALRALAEGAAARASFELKLDLPESIKDQPAEMEQIYYRIAQEALTNIVEHAGAKTVHLSLAAVDGSLRLSIRDDGRGFDPQAIDALHQFGLMGMKERAAMIGAEFTVTSRPGDGASVICTHPAGDKHKEPAN